MVTVSCSCVAPSFLYRLVADLLCGSVIPITYVNPSDLTFWVNAVSSLSPIACPLCCSSTTISVMITLLGRVSHSCDYTYSPIFIFY